MATLVLSFAGFVLGGPVFAAIGGAIGQQIDSRYLFPRHGIQEGPRLRDLHVQSAAYGEPAPLVYGKARVSGNVIWSTGLIETRHSDTQSVGGKGGGSKVTQETYTYSASFAVGLSARRIAGIGRIWADGKLLRDASGVMAAGGSLHIHLGGESQSPDARMQAALGLDATPAHRGIAYVLFEGLELADFGNRIPNLSFEVIADAVAPSLDLVVKDLAARSGVTDFDAAALATTSVTGFVLPGQATARDGIEALAVAFGFCVRETGAGLGFLPADRFPVRRLDPEALGARTSGQRGQSPFAFNRASFADVPADLAIRYVDAARDYQMSVQRARRDVARPGAPAMLDLAVVMTAAEAKAAAEARLGTAILETEGLSLRLTADHLDLEPGDVVALDLDGRDKAYEIRRVSFEGAATALELVAYDSADVSGTPGAAGVYEPPMLAGPVPTVFHLLDIPLLPWETDAGPRLLVAACGIAPGWRGAALFASTDGGARYDQVARLTKAAIAGTATLAPDAGPITFPDPASVIEVMLQHDEMALESRDPSDLLGGANLALLGDEILQFADAVQLSDGRWRLSGLLRGRCGTEAAVAGHVAGEAFVLLRAGDLTTVRPALSDIGRTVKVKPVGRGESLESVAAFDFRFTGASALPRSPAHLRGERASDGTVTFSWIRRARIGGDWRDGVDVPLGEEREAYEIEILSGGTVVRRLASGEPQIVYDAAAQIADFGVPPPAIECRVFQLSALLGRGAPSTAFV